MNLNISNDVLFILQTSKAYLDGSFRPFLANHCSSSIFAIFCLKNSACSGSSYIFFS